MRPGGEPTLGNEQANRCFPKDAKLRRPAGSRGARVEPRRAVPQSPPGPAGEERGAGTPSAGSGRQCAPGLNGGVRGSSDPPAARARLGRPLRATPGAMPPAPRAPRERREHGEVE